MEGQEENICSNCVRGCSHLLDYEECTDCVDNDKYIGCEECLLCLEEGGE